MKIFKNITVSTKTVFAVAIFSICVSRSFAEEFYKLMKPKYPPFEREITITTATNIITDEYKKKDRILFVLNGENKINQMIKFPKGYKCYGVCYKLKNGII